MNLIAVAANGAIHATLPRYDPFTASSLAVAKAGGRFVEIAGNPGVILVSSIVPAGWSDTGDQGFRLLFEQPVLIDLEFKRLVLEVELEHLDEILIAMDTAPNKLEHVYDY